MRTSSLEMRHELLSLKFDRAELLLVDEASSERVLNIDNAMAAHSKALAETRDGDTLPTSVTSEPECEAIYITANNTERGHSERHARMAVGCFR